mgnify:CR=1 FL=1
MLCTYVNTKLKSRDKRVIFYKTRSNLPGSVLCHLGEAHLGKYAKAEIIKKIEFKIPGLSKESIQPVGIRLDNKRQLAYVALGPANRVAIIIKLLIWGDTQEI